MISDEKRKTIEEAMRACTKNKENMRKALSHQHGVGVSTISRWERQAKEKERMLRGPSPVVHIAPTPPAAPPQYKPHPPQNITGPWLRHLAAQALFLAEQLETLAGTE